MCPLSLCLCHPARGALLSMLCSISNPLQETYGGLVRDCAPDHTLTCGTHTGSSILSIVLGDSSWRSGVHKPRVKITDPTTSQTSQWHSLSLSSCVIEESKNVRGKRWIHNRLARDLWNRGTPSFLSVTHIHAPIYNAKTEARGKRVLAAQ